MSRKTFSFLTAGLLAALVLTAAAKVHPVNKNRKGVAIKGYDPVAYFEQNGPLKGKSDFAHDWNGASWWFSSAANRDTFAAAPEKYAPQFGGYCAWAVSNGYTADTDPDAWRVVDGKLYLNYNKEVQRMWLQDVRKRIEDGNRNWPALHK
jgi:YHS domain-containing protein